VYQLQSRENSDIGTETLLLRALSNGSTLRADAVVLVVPQDVALERPLSSKVRERLAWIVAWASGLHL